MLGVAVITFAWILCKSYVPIISKFTKEWWIRTLNLGLLSTLQVTYMAERTKAPAEHQNGGKVGQLTKPVIAELVSAV